MAETQLGPAETWELKRLANAVGKAWVLRVWLKRAGPRHSLFRYRLLALLSRTRRAGLGTWPTARSGVRDRRAQYPL